MMNTTRRFDLAIQKLYSAFHNDQLHPECCKQCAVGNILDQTESWKHFSDGHGSTTLNYVGLVNQKFGKRFNGYSPLELLTIESIFLRQCGYQIPLHHENKKPETPTNTDILFEGLCAVIAYLCELDGIKNVTEFKDLFTIEKGSNFTLATI